MIKPFICTLIMLCSFSVPVNVNADDEDLGIDKELLGGVMDALKDMKARPFDKTPPESMPEKLETQLSEALRIMDLGMRSAVEGLRQGDTGDETQNAQQRVLEIMKKLVAATEQNQVNQDQSSGSESQKQSSKQQESDSQAPANQSKAKQKMGDRAGTDVGKSENVVVRALPVEALREHVWGHLPEQVRGRMRSSLPEEYMPKYRDAINEYFRRLSTSEKNESR